MSLKTWKEEFYPISANATKKEDALAHSLQKWRGLTKSNLKKHGVFNYRWYIAESEQGAFFSISNSSCSLCYHFRRDGEYSPCRSCPLYMIRDQCACDCSNRSEVCSPYQSFTVHDDPKPMIKWLRRALKLQIKT